MRPSLESLIHNAECAAEILISMVEDHMQDNEAALYIAYRLRAELKAASQAAAPFAAPVIALVA